MALFKTHSSSSLATLFVIFLSSFIVSSSNAQQTLIPLPARMQTSKGFFQTDSSRLFGKHAAKGISYKIDPAFDSSKPEGYRLVVNGKGISLKAGTQAGLFYGKQTLRQLLSSHGVPYVTIEDAPRFAYRGLHLDVSRHFFPKEEVHKLLDVMSYYKLNRLHLHLTDNGGWRIQIDKYPKLTTDAAFRSEIDYMHWTQKDSSRFVTKETPGSYGGFYTKQDIREMVAYAAARHIVIVPEIEFPGHSSEVFVAYPELSCTGKQYGTSDLCIGNEKTIQFMKDVLSEVIELFPSEYIHIGGDEADKTSWKDCDKCKALMQREGLKDVDELQSYMIKQCENFLKSKGRKMIGWDEILEGGLAPEATVMSWRGEEGGIASARMNHDVIMTPGTYCYFDHYQADPETQPLAIGGYLPLSKVYSYNPTPTDSLTPEQCKHIIGVQANTWSEFIPTTSHLEYMMFPRALALAEVAWTPQDRRSWQDFKKRANANIPILQKRGFNPYSNSTTVEGTMNVDNANKQIVVTLDPEAYPVELRYTTDGTIPTTSSKLYESPIVVKDSATIVSAIFRNGKIDGKPNTLRVDYHKAIGKPVHYNMPLNERYPAEGESCLVNGYRGGLSYQDHRWQGYLTDLDCVIDLGEKTDIHSVSSRWMRQVLPYIFQPDSVELFTSDDGTTFAPQGVIPTRIPESVMSTFETFTFQGNWQARYIRLVAKNPLHRNNGDTFIFTDEIVVW